MYNLYGVCICELPLFMILPERIYNWLFKSQNTTAGVSVNNACSAQVKYSSVACVSEEVGAEYLVFAVMLSTALHFNQPPCLVYYLSENRNAQTSVQTLVPASFHYSHVRGVMCLGQGIVIVQLSNSILELSDGQSTWFKKEMFAGEI